MESVAIRAGFNTLACRRLTAAVRPAFGRRSVVVHAAAAGGGGRKITQSEFTEKAWQVHDWGLSGVLFG
jgi:hypothetical protein